MKETAQRIFQKTLASIDIRATLGRKIPRDGGRIRAGNLWLNLRDHQEVVAIAFGKAALAMAQGLREILPEIRFDGILVVPSAMNHPLPGWTTVVGGHPIPNAQSFEAGRIILNRLSRCSEQTLVFFLLSGGGSALVEQALDPDVSLEDFQRLNSVLVTCGAAIEEINVVRKHLSAIKGGRLAAAAPRSMKVTLAISDVPQGHESALASGPTLPDPSTLRDTERIVSQYKLVEKLPLSIRRIFQEHQLRETPKPGDPAFRRSCFELLLGEHDLLHAAHQACEAEGYMCVCDTSVDSSLFEEAAGHLVSVLATQKKANPDRRVALLADGEVASPVTGDGIGGRNAAFVLACVPRIAGQKLTVLSAGTDGIDGNSPAAGAVADGNSLARANSAGLNVLDFLRRSDSYNFFARLGDALITGPTGNNLRDLRILLTE